MHVLKIKAKAMTELSRNNDANVKAQHLQNVLLYKPGGHCPNEIALVVQEELLLT